MVMVQDDPAWILETGSWQLADLALLKPKENVSILTKNYHEQCAIEKVLKSNGLKCFPATSTEEVINSVDWNNICAVIVGDIGQGSVTEFCRDLEDFYGCWRKPPVLVVVDSVDLPQLYQLAEAGAEFVIERPINAHELSLKLRALLEGVYTDLDAPNRVWVGATLGHFEIGKELGRGGTGIVYEAYDKSKGSSTALKILPPFSDLHSLLLFQREAEILGGLKHRNIVSIGETGRIDALYYMTLELLEKPLDLQISLDGPSLESYVRDILKQLAKALEYLHSKGVFHLDLKPANVLLRDHGTPIIADFGLSRLRQDKIFIRPNTIMGTLGYLSPEAAMCLDCDEQSDLFSLGILAIELLLGKNPSGNGSLATQLDQLKRARYRLEDEYKKASPSFMAVLDGLLEFDKNTRTKSATQLLQQLSRCA
jgi:CheY-like chemotaxis protein